MHTKDDELAKVQRHLTLLRSEYVHLQEKYHNLEQANAISSTSGSTSFVRNIMKTISGLFNQQQYSDIVIKLNEEEINAHKFVLAARSQKWSSIEDSFLDWTHLDRAIGFSLLKWIYSDQIDIPVSGDREDFILQLMRTSKAFYLSDLLTKCEEMLVSSVNVSNCIRFYATADEISADRLRKHCSELISANWNDFTSDDFADMTAQLLYKMLKEKSEFPLHSAIRLKREDVVFLYLIEFSSELHSRVNTCDESGSLPLDLALAFGQKSLAESLIEHRADVNQKNAHGLTLLHLAILRDDDDSCLFLIDHGANVNAELPNTFDTPLHFVSRTKAMQNVARALIGKGANVNAQNKEGRTALHNSIESDNFEVFQLLLDSSAATDIKSSDGFPPLWIALKVFEERNKFAEQLVQLRNASTSAICGMEGNSLLHHCALEGLEDAGIFLAGSKGCDVNRCNSNGETPLHLAANYGLDGLARALLDTADPNIQTIMNNDSEVFRQTPLHLAIMNRHVDVIRVIIDQVGKGDGKIQPDLNIKNSKDETPIGLALSHGLHDIAMDLLRGGASVNVSNSEGFTLLHLAIMNGDAQGALFLLNNGAEIDLRTESGKTPLELAIESNLGSVVEMLCRKGADLTSGSTADPPLWQALERNEDLASILVRHGVDTDGWSKGPDGCQQTLLHRAIDENNERAACFLIRSGCDLNSPRRPGPDGGGGDEAHDLATPLHLCCQWCLTDTARLLLEHCALVNARDAEGKTPFHVCIENSHNELIDLFLNNASVSGLDLSAKDKSGLSPFATAMTFKNNKAAKAILAIEPQAAELYDSRGRNFLHTAVLKNDLESVLFLLSINVNVNSRTQDANLLTPLLFAVQVGNDMIVRNLILAGASVNARNTSDQTGLHIAAETNLPNICSILLSEGIDFGAIDNRGNNALHLAVAEGHLEVVRILLTESTIDAEAVNHKGRNPLHVLCVFGKDNSSAIFDLFLECMPNYPINRPDTEGNTPLLLAYSKGNGSLCRSLVKAGATLGTMNNQGVSIFNCEVATKQLLMRLLDFLGQEPKWGEGDNCQECNTKFGITTRKHHCRHCGRLLCSKCSDKDMPILKYNLTKPVRVCDTCADVLTIGPGA